MARSAQKPSRDSGRRTGGSDELPPPSVLTRIAWVLLLVVWVFLVVSLVSFDAADFPSHTVAVHNEPAANLCGKVGALIAYGAYSVIGSGVWLIMAGIAGFLGVTVTGRIVTHPLLRLIGLSIAAIAASALHALLLPTAGPLVGAPAGVVAEFTVMELAPRFNIFGTFLLLACAFIIGMIVAVDWLVLRVPVAFYRSTYSALGMARKTADLFRSLRLRPERGFTEHDLQDGVTSTRRKKGQAATASINPDAGGLGGTEAFNPDEFAAAEDDDDQWDEDAVDDDDEDSEDDDYEWEYEDDDEEYDYDEEDEEDDAETSHRQPLTAEELREKIARLPLRMGTKNKTIARDEDIPREENFEGYRFPTLDLLDDPMTNYNEELEAAVRRQAEKLEESLQIYGIDGEVVGIESGPTVTLYSVQLAPGTKVAKVQTVATDLARSLSAQNVRVVPNMTGRTTIGIEVPNPKKEIVRLKELMSGGHAEGMKLPMFLGKDASGEPLVADLTRMPHMLIAGTTGSGKSVCMNTIIVSWLYTKRPDELKLVLVDPKMVELSQFQDIPHLMCPVVTEMGRAAAILDWAVNKMEERYELLKEAQVRDVDSYNELGEEGLYEMFEPESDEERARIPKKLPYIVFVIDELADLMLTHKEVEQSIVRIAQKARAVGIHLILATQRPQANVVTGLIKSNMPCRVSFKVSSGMDSRIVLDQKGAELLLGEGDMMFLTPHTHEVARAQGTYVSDREIRKVSKHLRDVAEPNFERSLLAIRPGADDEAEGLDAAERDPLFDDAVEIMIETGRGSVSLLQRRLSIGYSRASRLVDQMGMAGILGDHKGSVARDVLITMEDWERMKALEAGEDVLGGSANDDADAYAEEDGYDEEEDEDYDDDGDEGEYDEDDDEYEYEYEYVDEDEDEEVDDEDPDDDTIEIETISGVESADEDEDEDDEPRDTVAARGGTKRRP